MAEIAAPASLRIALDPVGLAGRELATRDAWQAAEPESRNEILPAPCQHVEFRLRAWRSRDILLLRFRQRRKAEECVELDRDTDTGAEALVMERSCCQ